MTNRTRNNKGLVHSSRHLPPGWAVRAAVLVLGCLLLAGCTPKKIVVYYPGITGRTGSSLDQIAVAKAFRRAADLVMGELGRRPAFKNVILVYKQPGGALLDDIEQRGAAALQPIAKQNAAEGVLYVTIHQPFDAPFCESALNYYVAESEVRSHQTRAVLMNYDTFYRVTFWKAELYKLLGDIEKVL